MSSAQAIGRRRDWSQYAAELCANCHGTGEAPAHGAMALCDCVDLVGYRLALAKEAHAKEQASTAFAVKHGHGLWPVVALCIAVWAFVALTLLVVRILR